MEAFFVNFCLKPRFNTSWSITLNTICGSISCSFASLWVNALWNKQYAKNNQNVIWITVGWNDHFCITVSIFHWKIIRFMLMWRLSRSVPNTVTSGEPDLLAGTSQSWLTSLQLQLLTIWILLLYRLYFNELMHHIRCSRNSSLRTVQCL